MTPAMLSDLSKELLKELGVVALGDCIAILKKAHHLVSSFGMENGGMLDFYVGSNNTLEKASRLAKNIV